MQTQSKSTRIINPLPTEIHKQNNTVKSIPPDEWSQDRTRASNKSNYERNHNNRSIIHLSGLPLKKEKQLITTYIQYFNYILM